MQRLMVSLISLGMMFGSLIAGAAGDAKAEDLLKQARAALGGEKPLAKAQGLSCVGTVQRSMELSSASGGTRCSPSK